MKKVDLFLLIFFGLLFVECDTTTNVGLSSYSKDIIDVTDNYQFPEGIYFEYNFSSSSETIDPEKEIKKLLAEDVIVSQGWYRHPLTGCSHPGGATTRTIYKSAFVILLKYPANGVSDKNYSKLLKEPAISCGYHVVNYKLKE